LFPQGIAGFVKQLLSRLRGAKEGQS
jgi:branched-chain amino acid transport system permease protein